MIWPMKLDIILISSANHTKRYVVISPAMSDIVIFQKWIYFDLTHKIYKEIYIDLTRNARYGHIIKTDIFWSRPQNIKRNIFWSHRRCRIWSQPDSTFQPHLQVVMRSCGWPWKTEESGIIKQTNQEISNKWTGKYKTNSSRNIKFPIKLPLAPCRVDPENTFRHKLKRKKIF